MPKKNIKNFDGLKIWLVIVVSILSISILVYMVSITMNAFKKHRFIGKDQETITVQGRGEVYAAPDLGMMVFSVINEGKTVAEVVEQNTRAMNEVIEVLKETGVLAEDLKTTAFDLYPRYDYLEERGKRVLVGYEISQRLEVKIRDLDKLGLILQAATEAGANQMGSLSFIVDDEEGYKKQARELAIKDANQKALEIVSQLGLEITGIKSFTESISPAYFTGYEAVPKTDSSVEIETGQNKIEVLVNIVYKIED